MMDAISFVLGLQARHLRGNSLKDLVFRVEGSDSGPSTASVSLIYAVDAGELPGRAAGSEIEFTRQISPAGVSTYKLDGKEVVHSAYDAQLKEIGVLTKARNFLVFQVRSAYFEYLHSLATLQLSSQGDVQHMGNMDSSRMLMHLEQISGSHAFK